MGQRMTVSHTEHIGGASIRFEFPDTYPYISYPGSNGKPAVPCHVYAENPTYNDWCNVDISRYVRNHHASFEINRKVMGNNDGTNGRPYEAIVYAIASCKPISPQWWIIVETRTSEHRGYVGYYVWGAPAFPSVSIEGLDVPSLASAGSKLSVPFTVKNTGAKGKVRALLNGSTLFEETIGEGAALNRAFDLTMGCNPLSGTLKLENVGECGEWRAADYKSFMTDLSLPDLKIESLSPPKLVPANQPFSIPIILRNGGGPGDVRCMLADKELYSGRLDSGESIKKTLSFTMPCHDITHVFHTESKGECGQWERTDRKAAPIKASFPNLKIDSIDVPGIVAAGERYPVDIGVLNKGAPGDVRFMSGHTELFSGKLEESKSIGKSLSFTMLYDDVTHHFYAESKVECGKWERTDRKEVPIKAGFPESKLVETPHTESIAPGKSLSISPLIMNNGYTGEIGVKVRDIHAGQAHDGDTQRVGHGGDIRYSFEKSMPAVETSEFGVTPLHVGRHKERVAGSETTFFVDAMNAVFAEDDHVTYIGNEEMHLVAGVIAAKSLLPETGETKLMVMALPGLAEANFTALTPTRISSLPPGPPLMQAMAFSLSMERFGKTLAFSYNELIYLRFHSEVPVSVCRGGKVQATDTKDWEYSKYPTPTSMLNQVNSLMTQLSRPGAKIR